MSTERSPDPRDETAARSPHPKGSRKRPARWRRWLVRPAFWFLTILISLAALALWLLQRPRVQDRIVDRVLPMLEERLGRDLEVESVRWTLLPLSVEARGVRIAGPSPDDPPLATAERLRVGADWAEIGRDRLRLESLEGEGIVFYLERYAEGGDNVPRWRGSGGGGGLEVDLGTIEIRDSRFVYDDRQVPLSLTARHVRADLVGIGGRQIQGDVVAEQVDFDLPTAEPYRAAVSARIVLGARGLRIQGGRVNAPDAALRVHGRVEWGEEDHVRLELEGPVDAELFRALGYVDEQIAGNLEVDGTFAWNDGVWGFRGRASSPSFRLVDWTLRELDAAITGDRNSVWLDLRSARYGSGSIAGRVEVDLSGDLTDTVVRLQLEEIDAESAFSDAGIPVEGISARLTGELDFRFSENDWEQGSGWGVVDVDARARRAAGLPLEGTIPLTVEGGRLEIRAARLRAPGQDILAGADYDLRTNRGEIRFEIESRDLGPLRELIPVSEEEPALWLPSEGRGRIAGRLELRPEGPRAPLRLDLRDVRAPGLSADRARGVLTITDDAVRDLRLEIDRGTSAAIVTGQFPFEGRGLTATVDVASWPVSEAAPWLPFELPVEGRFTGGISLRQPAADLQGTLGGFVEDADLAGVGLERIEADLTWDEEAVVVRSVSLTAPAGVVRARGSLGLEESRLDFALQAEDLALSEAPLSAYLGGGGLVGRLDVTAAVGGTAESPRIDARLRAADLSLDGKPLGETEDPTTLALRLRDGQLDVEGSFLGLGSLDGGGRWDTRAVDLDLEFRIPELERLVALAIDTPLAVDGVASGSLRVTGEPLAPDVTIRVDDLAAQLEGRPVRNLEPVVVEIHPGRVRIRSLYLGTPGGASELFLAGEIGLGEGKPLDLNLQATVVNRFLSPWLPGVRLGGATDVLGSVEGTVANPRFNGQAEIRDGDLIVEALPFRVDDLRAVILAYPEFVVLDLARGELGGGTVRASGRLSWPTASRALDARVQTAFEDVTLRYPEGWLLRGDGELVWSVEEDRQLVRGLVELDRAYYLRDLEVGIIQLLQRFFRHERQEVGTTDEELAAVDLNVLVRAPGTLRVRNNLADLSGRAELTVRGTLARPILFGRAEAETGGTLVYNDNRYMIERGVLQFANPYRMEPILDLVATTDVADYDVTLSLFGSLDRLAASFASDPPLPDLEVLSLLVSGTPTRLSSGFSGLDPQQSSTSAAEGLLFGQAASLISERVGSLFGFDAFRIEPLSTSGGQVSSARVTVGKRFSSRLYVTYSYDPSSTDEQRIQLEYLLGEGWILRLTQEGDDYTVDLLRERRF